MEYLNKKIMKYQALVAAASCRVKTKIDHFSSAYFIQKKLEEKVDRVSTPPHLPATNNPPSPPPPPPPHPLCEPIKVKVESRERRPHLDKKGESDSRRTETGQGDRTGTGQGDSCSKYEYSTGHSEIPSLIEDPGGGQSKIHPNSPPL